jgi:predicted transcriptional regulator
MSAISLRLPNSLHKKLGDLARREGVSINQLVNSAVAEKMASLMTAEYLQDQAKRGTRKKFEAVLAKVSNREPEASDRLPNKRLERTSKKARRSAAKRSAAPDE